MPKVRKIGRHKSIPRAIKRAVKNIQSHAEVKRVILGTFHPCRHKHTVGSLEFREEVGQGMKLYGYCGGGICNVFVYLRDLSRREVTRRELGL